ncbi:MAG: RNA polymerase sigma factor [Acetobacteraceae bacterium]
MYQPDVAERATVSETVEVHDADIARRFAIISRQYNRRLFRLARSILRDEAEAEDAVQEAYVRALSGLATLADPARIGAWLARITVNEALGRLRRRRTSVPLEEIADALPDVSARSTFLLSPFGRVNPEDAAMQTEVKKLLERAVDTLPVHFRTVFVACEIEQMSVAEAAAALAINPVTVKTRLFRARRQLRRALGAQFIAGLPAAFPCAGARCDRITSSVLARIAPGLRRSDPSHDHPAEGESS